MKNDFGQFIETLKNRTCEELALLANEEATSAERAFIKTGQEDLSFITYTTQLKKLVIFLKSGVSPKYLESDVQEKSNLSKGRNVRDITAKNLFLESENFCFDIFKTAVEIYSQFYILIFI
jgi:hypothetical protein